MDKGASSLPRMLTLRLPDGFGLRVPAIGQYGIKSASMSGCGGGVGAAVPHIQSAEIEGGADAGDLARIGNNRIFRASLSQLRRPRRARSHPLLVDDAELNLMQVNGMSVVSEVMLWMSQRSVASASGFSVIGSSHRFGAGCPSLMTPRSTAMNGSLLSSG
jgi:hypothetical protein